VHQTGADGLSGYGVPDLSMALGELLIVAAGHQPLPIGTKLGMLIHNRNGMP
jgi:hypothetical protein